MSTILQKPKVLVVDDEPNIVKAVTAYLRLRGYQTFGLEDPTQALALVQRENVFIVLSDLVMPGMDGMELLRQLKQYNGLIQVILMTGFVKMDSILRGFAEGANNCFFKPFENLDEVGEEIDLAARRLRRIQEVLRQQQGMGVASRLGATG